MKSFCAQYKQGNSSLYGIFLLICQFIIECTDVEAFLAALDGFVELLNVSFLLTVTVERLLIGHHRLDVSCHYYSFCVNSFNLTFLILLSVNCKYNFWSKSFDQISIA